MRTLSAVLSVRTRAGLIVSSLTAAACAGLLWPAAQAHADTAPDPGTPATVSADALPTVQQNGVVWSQVTVGNTVYATGSFSQTWPAGTTQAAGPVTARGNLLAFDITTGNLIASFNHTLNAQGLAITASTDGSRVYVGGDFTTVDGVTRNHIAAFNTATGALDTNFHPSIGGQVAALAATNATVYAGGNFFSAAGLTRTRLAAFTASSGAVTNWAPTADDNLVSAMVLTPDKSRVIVGGRFSTLNGASALGMGSLDAATGANQPWAITSAIRDAGNKCGILSLSADSSHIYGSGFAFGCGNFEGTFSADPNTGSIVWINDCHGDTYSTYSSGSVLYSVSHAHECSAMGGFPDTNPRVWHHALAFSATAGGTNVGPDDYGWNFNGIPAASLLHWYPSLGIGSYTGQYQAAWSATGNGTYLSLGGEFPNVNGKAQQGLVRFAIPSTAPDKVAPVATSTITPKAVSLSAGTARVAWQATWDYDNQKLTYNVLRDGVQVGTVTAKSNFWQLPALGYIDKGLAPGSTHTYRIGVVDPNGNKIGSGTSNTVTITSAAQSAYASDVMSDGASNFWRLGESSGTTGYDWAGFSDLTEGTGVGHNRAGAIVGDSDSASTFDGTDADQSSIGGAIDGPNTFSLESWINTTTTSGGKIIGFGNTPSGAMSGAYDRHLYMDNSGHVVYGVYNNGVYTVTSPKTYNDGQWHQIVGTLSSDGMVLYIDGKKIGTNHGTTQGQAYQGYWRVGGDNLNGWPSQPSSADFAGGVDDVAVYPAALTLAQVQKHYTDSGRGLNQPPAPTDAYGQAVYGSQPDLYWRLDDANGPTSVDVTPNGDDGNDFGGLTYRAASTVTGPTGTGTRFNGSTGLVVASQPVSNPTVYSEELWFNTSTTQGGKLIGFGDASSGNSSNYDRHVYMLDSGQLLFGAYTGQLNEAISPASYNDGHWHYLVATQGSDGMKLWVDDQLVATNAQTGAQAYSGYWRIGGDNTWGGASSNYFQGTLDEVAVYSTVLSPSAISAHWHASGAVVNQPPQAKFTSSCTDLGCSFDGSTSNDPDGSIASYSWDFGDGATGTGPTPSHTYGAANTYSVKLTVTDDTGATDSVTHTVTPTAPPNQPPHALFSSSCTNLACSFDGSTSNDPDGSIASYSWDFGDGATGIGPTPSHTYGAANTYTVKLTVTDNGSASDSATHSVVVTVAANQPPNAVFTSNCTALGCSFDASTSNDPDGSIASYAWDFGDGTTGSGKTPSNTYAAAGDYTVKLTVTDNQGATNSTTHVVSPRPPANPPAAPYASDAFNRTVTNGFGTADTGGAWTTIGNKANLSVSGGSATLAMPAATAAPGALLNSISQNDAETTATLTSNKPAVGGSIYMYVIGRHVGTNAEYRARVRVQTNNIVGVAITELNGSASETVIGKEVNLAGVNFTGGQQLKVRFRVTGTSPTTLQLKVWPAASTEPTAWQISTTDSAAALQAKGSVGLSTYLGGAATNAPVNMLISSFASSSTVAPPTASFTTNCVNRACSTDASASTDPSGTISSYKYSWGDGTVTTGVTSSHTFAAAGTYRITLTVTDPSGWTDVTTRTVTVA